MTQELPFRVVIMAGIVLVHLSGVLHLLTTVSGGYRTRTDRAVQPFRAFIINGQENLDTVPIPDIPIEPARVDLTSLKAIQFEDPDEVGLSGVIGSTSAPRLSRVQAVDVTPFAEKAGLKPGQVISVVLVVDVLPDGTVSHASVSRGTGNALIDGAALEYARLLRWIPGTIDHRPASMRVNLPVILTARQA